MSATGPAKALVVTGGTDGIGRARAEARLERGDTVVIFGRDPDKGEAFLGPACSPGLFEGVELLVDDAPDGGRKGADPLDGERAGEHAAVVGMLVPVAVEQDSRLVHHGARAGAVEGEPRLIARIGEHLAHLGDPGHQHRIERARLGVRCRYPGKVRVVAELFEGGVGGKRAAGGARCVRGGDRRCGARRGRPFRAPCRG